MTRVHDVQEIRGPDGRTLTVSEGGDPGGVPVLVHVGTPGGSMPYQPHLEDAAPRGIRLFAYDRPGYGGSTRNPGRTVADCAADVAAICDALGIERFCALGRFRRRAARARDRGAPAGAVCCGSLARVDRAVRRGGPRHHGRDG